MLQLIHSFSLNTNPACIFETGLAMGARLAFNSWFCLRVLPLNPWQRWNYGQAPPCSAVFSTVCRSLSWVGIALDKAKGYLKKLSQNPSNKFSLKQLQCRVFSKTVQEDKSSLQYLCKYGYIALESSSSVCYTDCGSPLAWQSDSF